MKEGSVVSEAFRWVAWRGVILAGETAMGCLCFDAPAVSKT